ncbi:MAG: 1-deoxy-D-xylulose-5-phosphate reductoisomerase [Arsenophonus endosymbiont of Ceratovacuna japonica]
MINITILGSTGSIGKMTLSIVKKNLDKFKIIALLAHKNVDIMVQQCLEFQPQYATMSDEKSANNLRSILNKQGCSTEVLLGKNRVCELAELDNIDQVMSSITGISGLIPTFAAIRKGKRILLANKESLIVSGRLFFNEIKKYNAQVLPVDSEHNSIFQSLPIEIQRNLGFATLEHYGITSIVLTGSGGPLRKIPLINLKNIIPNEVCNHPNWLMGNKISVDSATMINKGFEYIEARYFFNASDKQLEIIIHPQSIIHSMVKYKDGSVITQLGSPDMRIFISYSMSYPNRIISGASMLNFKQLSSLTFFSPDYQRYPCLKLAIDACHDGQAATIILNAANEVSVDAFLNKKIRFTDIAQVNLNIVEKLHFTEPNSIDEILEINNEARQMAINYIKKISVSF